MSPGERLLLGALLAGGLLLGACANTGVPPWVLAERQRFGTLEEEGEYSPTVVEYPSESGRARFGRYVYQERKGWSWKIAE